MNQFFLRGNLIEKPSLKYTPAGLAIATLVIAGAMPERKWYHRVNLYGTSAEIFAETQVNTVLAVLGNYQQRESVNKIRFTNLVGNTVRAVKPLPSDTWTTDARDNRILEAVNPTDSAMCFISGNVTKDVRLAETGRGRVANVYVAINEYVKGEQTTTFLQATAFDDGSAYEVMAGVSKGTYVVVHGVPLINRWTDKEGNTRYDPNVIAVSLHVGTREGMSVPETVRAARPAGPSRVEINDEFPPEDSLPF